MSDYVFEHLPVSNQTHAQIRQILRSAKLGSRALKDRSRLNGLLLARSYDSIAQTYIPASPDIYLKGKLPDHSKGLPSTVEQFLALSERPAFFTNMLAIPSGYGTAGFDSKRAAAPRDRVVNGGLLVITIEFDKDDPAFLDQQFRGCEV